MKFRDNNSSDSMKGSGFMTGSIMGKALKKSVSIVVILSLLMFGLIFIFAPGLAADLGILCVGCLADE
ncbi:MAG: hypothetical protein ABFD08_15940 [Syntrophomonas sp.]